MATELEQAETVDAELPGSVSKRAGCAGFVVGCLVGAMLALLVGVPLVIACIRMLR